MRFCITYLVLSNYKKISLLKANFILKSQLNEGMKLHLFLI